FQAEDGIRDRNVTGVQTCALPISYIVWKNCYNSSILQFFRQREGAGKICGRGRADQQSFFFSSLPDKLMSPLRAYLSNFIGDRQIGRASCRERVRETDSGRLRQ